MNNEVTMKQQFKEYAKPMIIRSLFNGLMHTADKLMKVVRTLVTSVVVQHVAN